MKKILKYIGAAIAGGLVGTQVPAEIANVPPEYQNEISAIIAALVTLLYAWLRSPKDEPKE